MPNEDQDNVHTEGAAMTEGRINLSMESRVQLEKSVVWDRARPENEELVLKIADARKG